MSNKLNKIRLKGLNPHILKWTNSKIHKKLIEKHI